MAGPPKAVRPSLKKADAREYNDGFSVKYFFSVKRKTP